jgi:hypothetical protein
MSLSIGAIASKASWEDGNWCGTPPGPRPHFELGSLLEKIALNPQPLPPKSGIQHLLDDFCGTGRKPHFPPPPPPPLGEAAGKLSHLVQLALRM